MWDQTGGRLQPVRPRSLTDSERGMLMSLGFKEVALRFAGPCEDCGASLSGTTHYMMCRRPYARTPEKAQEGPIQPWEPQRSRRS